jgi:uncharacterized membrane protein
MIIWLLVLLLLIIFIYVVYRINFSSDKDVKAYKDEHHYTFKI